MSRSPSWYADVPTRPPARAPAPTTGGRWRKTCGAICAAWGYGCQRLAPHPGLRHRHGRGEFERVAAPGQTSFPRVEQLVAVAESRSGETELSSARATGTRLEAAAKRRARAVAPAAVEVADA